MSTSIDAIRKSNRSVSNRIQSILEDAEFVKCVASTYSKPLIPNKRCGLWYVSPEDRAGDACFKSTDGHTGQWGFSLKRLNLHLAPLIDKEAGCVLVDSTRRGKRMPDAFSKTVPIWCAVLNCVLFDMDIDSASHFPRDIVSSSEIDQIKSRISYWVEQFKRDVPQCLYPRLSRPLRPLWVTPDAPLPVQSFNRGDIIIPEASAVILCTASRQAQDGEVYLGFTYVQGAADDHELWAPKGLTPELLYSNSDLRECGLSDSELSRRIEAAVLRPSIDSSIESVTAVQVTPSLSVAHAEQSSRIDGKVIDLRPLEGNQWGLATGKRGARELANKLPTIAAHFSDHPGKYTIVSEPNTDFAEAVALMLDCRFFDMEGKLLATPNLHVTKDEVTRRNIHIIANAGQAPSRTTQNSIGSFLRGSNR